MARSCPTHDTPQFDCIDCRRTANIPSGSCGEGPVDWCLRLDDSVESYAELGLNALDHPESLVADLRTIGDFCLDDVAQ